MWYKAWARYAWKAIRPEQEEQAYWTAQLSAYYGISETQSTALLLALDEIGEISPKILRRFGITDGNRQTSSLGIDRKSTRLNSSHVNISYAVICLKKNI